MFITPNLIIGFWDIQKYTLYFKRRFTVKHFIYLVSDRDKLLNTRPRISCGSKLIYGTTDLTPSLRFNHTHKSH